MKKTTFAVVCAATLLTGASADTKPSLDSAQPTARVDATRLPPADRLWTVDDYEALVQAFADTAPTRLPSHDGANASPLFARIVDPANLRSLQDNAVPLPTRVIACERLMLASAKILMFYVPVVIQDRSRADDLLWLEGLLMQETGVMIGMVDEVRGGNALPGVDQDQVQQGLTRITAGIEQAMDGVIRSLREAPKHPGDARAHLAQVVAAEYPKMANYLNPASRRRVEADLGKLAREDSDAGVRSALATYTNRQPGI
jgi:hypothetical protein